MVAAPAELNERFCLAAFEDGGILLDLHGGGYYQVNATGAWLLERTLAEGIEAAAQAGAARWRVSAETTRADIEKMLSPQGELPGKPGHPQLSFEAEPGRIVLFWEGVPAIEASGVQPALRLLWPDASRAGAFVHMILPKAAALVGLDVVHASAVQVKDLVIAFSGVSGAGKSTTAGSVAAAGGLKLVEDILVLAPGDRAAIVLGAEERFVSWKARASAALQQGETAALTELRGMDHGNTMPIGAILFLDATRRAGDRFNLQRLSRPEAAVAALENAFVGSVTPAAWRRHLAAAMRVASQAKAYRITAPLGLDALRQAAGNLYSTISAS